MRQLPINKKMTLRLPKLAELGKFLSPTSELLQQAEAIVNDHVVFGVQLRFLLLDTSRWPSSLPAKRVQHALSRDVTTAPA
jgi:hypothetical protein